MLTFLGSLFYFILFYFSKFHGLLVDIETRKQNWPSYCMILYDMILPAWDIVHVIKFICFGVTKKWKRVLPYIFRFSVHLNFWWWPWFFSYFVNVMIHESKESNYSSDVLVGDLKETWVAETARHIFGRIHFCLEHNNYEINMMSLISVKA